MKKIYTLCAMIVLLFTLSGCGSNEEISATKTPFPEMNETDFEGNIITNDIFSEYDATIVNFWNNMCGTCIEEMPELEELYHEFKDKNINLIGIGTDSGTSEEHFEFAKKITMEKGVTYMNVSPNKDGSFYNEYIPTIFSYPTTYVVDSEGNIIGTSIVGNVKKQEEALNNRIDAAIKK